METKIKKWLADEESRYIFEKRIEYNTTGNYRVFEDIIHRYVKEYSDNVYYPGKEKEIIQDICDKHDIWIYGAGIRGKRLYKFLSDAGIEIMGFIDRRGINIDVMGITILEPEKANWSKIDCLIISMLDERMVQECINIAGLMGCNGKIVLYSDYTIASLCEKQYFDEIITFQEYEVFVDAGVLDLSTSLEFAKKCEENHVSHYKILAFEPDKYSFQKCLEIKKNNPEVDIRLFDKGLYSSDTVLSFDASHDGSAHLSNNTEVGGGENIEVMKLDSVMDEKITFIKMDIEGAELEALKGAQRIIRNDKPKLAISVYHKKEDVIDIPLYIKSLNEDYKLYLRHYSNGASETILYAIP